MTALDYSTYRLADQSPHCDDEIARKVSKLAKEVEFQLKSQKCEGYNPISILSFLQPFQMALDTIGIHESAAMWQFHFFIKIRPAAPSVPGHAWPAAVVRTRKVGSHLNVKSSITS